MAPRIILPLGWKVLGAVLAGGRVVLARPMRGLLTLWVTSVRFCRVEVRRIGQQCIRKQADVHGLVHDHCGSTH
jgi:hypothetical protein